MKRKLCLILSLALITSTLMTGCAIKNNPNETKNIKGKLTENPAQAREGAENTIIIGMQEGKGNLLPIYNTTTNDQIVVDYIFDSLMTNDEEGNLIPHIAKDWELSDDKKTYTFHLRDDVKFSDGEPLTAKDVEFTYLVLADPNYDGSAFRSVAKMEGYEKYHKGDAKNISGIKVIDDHTISFTFKEPQATNIWECNVGIMPKHHYYFEKGDIYSLKQKMHKSIGSGPYIMTEYEPMQYVHYKANKNYFLGTPKIENLILKFIIPEVQIQELQNGDVDIVLHAPPSPDTKKLVDDMKYFHINSYPNSGYSYMGWNLRDPRFADTKVRQALTYGFNRAQFVETYFSGYGSVCNTPLSPVSWAYTDELDEKINEYKYNPEKACEILEEAGWKLNSEGIREKNGKKLDFVLTIAGGVEWMEEIASVLQEEWKKIGVNLNIHSMHTSALLNQIFEKRDFDLYCMSWDLNPDPDALSIFHSEADQPGGNNTVGFHNNKNDKLLEAGIAEFDPEKRKDIYNEWGLIMNEELPYMFIYMEENWNIINNRVENIECSPFINIANPKIVLSMDLKK